MSMQNIPRKQLLMINSIKSLDFLWTAIESPEEYRKRKCPFGVCKDVNRNPHKCEGRT